MACGFCVPTIGPSSSNLTRSSPSLHRLRSGCVRLLHRYYKKTPTSLTSSEYLIVLVPLIPCAIRSYRHRTLRRPGLFLKRCLHRLLTAESERPPRFLEDPLVYHALLLDSAEQLTSGYTTQVVLPSTLKTVSASDSYSFRSSITRPGNTLCTLRS